MRRFEKGFFNVSEKKINNGFFYSDSDFQLFYRGNLI